MGKLGVDNIETTSTSLFEKISIEHIFEICKSRGFCCAVYRLPDSLYSETEKSHFCTHLIIDLSSGKNLENLHLDEMGSGFIFHPFSSEHHPTKFIQRDIHIVAESKSSGLKLAHSKIDPDEFLKVFSGQEKAEFDLSHSPETKIGIQDSTDEEKKEFLDLLNETIEQINLNRFQKVVIARSKKISLPDKFSAVDFFNTLTRKYTNAFTYLTYIPNIGTWLGATPETLINIDRKRQFKTIALAATQAFNEKLDIEDTTWSQKDIEEQAMVSRYIINCFKKIRLREFEEIGPRTHLSGNLVHLKTDYIVEMDQVAFPELGTVMLEVLHPTSAVCGMPKEPAMDFILNHEGFDRGYFSGFLGPVNMNEETNIFVNLRCMQLFDNQAQLFAGAGIISNSNPDKEWNETEIKMETLLKVLRDQY